MKCGDKENIAATHKNNDLISEITLPWKAPTFTSGPDKTVEFKFTVVKDFSTFWVKESGTNTVTITKAASKPEPEVEPEPDVESEPEVESEQEGVVKVEEGDAESEAESERDSQSINGEYEASKGTLKIYFSSICLFSNGLILKITYHLPFYVIHRLFY